MVAGGVLRRTIDFILPHRCLPCGNITHQQGELCATCWSTFQFISQPHCHRYNAPFAFGTGDATIICSYCDTKPPPFEALRAVFAYDDTSKGMILRFKHNDATFLAPSFGEWMTRACSDFMDDVDSIMPVPLHWTRLLKRWYNQAALLANAMGHVTQKPVLHHVLKRNRATASQGFMKAAERHDNVCGAFTVNHGTLIEGKTILLVDDVYTTGATVKECTTLLRANGAARIYVATLARVCHERYGA